MTTPSDGRRSSIKSTAGTFGRACARPQSASSSVWMGRSPCDSTISTCACAGALRRWTICSRPKPPQRNHRKRPAIPSASQIGWTISHCGLAPLCARRSGCRMHAVEHGRGNKDQEEGRAKPARPSFAFHSPRPQLLGGFTKESMGSKPKPSAGDFVAAIRGSVADAFFGASPVVASALGIRSGATPRGRHQRTMDPPGHPSKQDTSTLLGIGPFYFALTRLRRQGCRAGPTSIRRCSRSRRQLKDTRSLRDGRPE